jgi:hypothetical protein
MVTEVTDGPPELGEKTLLPVEFELSETVRPPDPAVTGLPKLSRCWTVIGPSVAEDDAEPDTGADEKPNLLATCGAVVNVADPVTPVAPLSVTVSVLLPAEYAVNVELGDAVPLENEAGEAG